MKLTGCIVLSSAMQLVSINNMATGAIDIQYSANHCELYCPMSGKSTP